MTRHDTVISFHFILCPLQFSSLLTLYNLVFLCNVVEHYIRKEMGKLASECVECECISIWLIAALLELQLLHSFHLNSASLHRNKEFSERFGTSS